MWRRSSIAMFSGRGRHRSILRRGRWRHWRPWRLLRSGSGPLFSEHGSMRPTQDGPWSSFRSRRISELQHRHILRLLGRWMRDDHGPDGERKHQDRPRSSGRQTERPGEWSQAPRGSGWGMQLRHRSRARQAARRPGIMTGGSADRHASVDIGSQSARRPAASPSCVRRS